MLFLQYLLGLRALGHEVFWLDRLQSSGDRVHDHQLMDRFFKRFERYGFRDCCAVVVYDKADDETNLDRADVRGVTKEKIREIAQSSDVLLNFCCCLRQPLLSLFKHRVLVDLDPGVLQACALEWDLCIHDHQIFLTVGSRMAIDGCRVPTLGVNWRSFAPFVYLPMWEPAADPGDSKPFSSVTEWTWHTISLHDELVSCSKRDAYLKYIELPQRTRVPFELAANIDPQDEIGDRELLRRNGWRLVHPHEVAHSPSFYQNYIRNSRAEIGCAKPIYTELKTGWFSDRSACYLASGRPVLAEDTGFGRTLPVGEGLVAFHTLDEAAAGTELIAHDYQKHSRAARAIAEEYFDSNKVLGRLIEEVGIAP